MSPQTHFMSHQNAHLVSLGKIIKITMSSETRHKYLHKGLRQEYSIWYSMQICRNTYLRVRISQTFTLFRFHSACQIIIIDVIIRRTALLFHWA